MIDLHSHIISEAQKVLVDEHNVDWESVLNIARMALEDGIDHIVWTPEYSASQINDSDVSRNEFLLNALNQKLLEAGFPITLSLSADFHLDLRENVLKVEDIERAQNSRYVLLSFSQVYLPTHFESIIRNLLDNGYVPVIAHPERLGWINEKYHVIRSLIDDGAWIQITADSFTGYFGRKAQYWAERFLSEGIIHVIASEANSADRRPPVLSEAKQFLASNLSREEVKMITEVRPQLMVSNEICPLELLPPGVNYGWQTEKVS